MGMRTRTWKILDCMKSGLCRKKGRDGHNEETTLNTGMKWDVPDIVEVREL
jgi:hypothetical protein